MTDGLFRLTGWLAGLAGWQRLVAWLVMVLAVVALPSAAAWLVRRLGPAVPAAGGCPLPAPGRRRRSPADRPGGGARRGLGGRRLVDAGAVRSFGVVLGLAELVLVAHRPQSAVHPAPARMGLADDLAAPRVRRRRLPGGAPGDPGRAPHRGRPSPPALRGRRGAGGGRGPVPGHRDRPRASVAAGAVGLPAPGTAARPRGAPAGAASGASGLAAARGAVPARQPQHPAHGRDPARVRVLGRLAPGGGRLVVRFGRAGLPGARDVGVGPDDPAADAAAALGLPRRAARGRLGRRQLAAPLPPGPDRRRPVRRGAAAVRGRRTALGGQCRREPGRPARFRWCSSPRPAAVFARPIGPPTC